MREWLLLLLLGSLGATCMSNQTSKMDTVYQDDLIRVLSGNTFRLPDLVAIPPFIESDRGHWALVLLTSDYQYLAQELQPFLGKGETPDLIRWHADTEIGRVQGIETPHHWMLMADDAASLSTQLQTLLSLEAQQALHLDQWTADAAAEDSASFVWLNRPPTVPMSLLSSWQEASFLFRYQGDFYAVFFKYQNMTAVPGFYPGLDWFPDDLRMAYGLQPRS